MSSAAESPDANVAPSRVIFNFDKPLSGSTSTDPQRAQAACTTVVPWNVPSGQESRVLQIGDVNQDTYADVAVLGCDDRYGVYYGLTAEARYFSPVDPKKYKALVLQFKERQELPYFKEPVDFWVVDNHSTGAGHLETTLCLMSPSTPWTSLSGEPYRAEAINLGNGYFLLQLGAFGFYMVPSSVAEQVPVSSGAEAQLQR